jgi:hypothetical protein
MIFFINLYFISIDISASEGSYVSSESILKQTIMDLNARGRAEINIKLDAQSKCKVGNWWNRIIWKL